MPSKLGQHFLFRDSILDRIARAAGIASLDSIVEIGAGRGALTGHLLQHSGRVVAIEVDRRLVEVLRAKFSNDTRLTLVEGDVLEIDLAQWGPATITGNLPYYISSPILRRFFQLGQDFPTAVFLLQKEVADRLTASPGSRAYGYLTVETQIFTKPELLFNVPASAFHPRPKVDSAVVRLTRHPKATTAIPCTDSFLTFAGRCFAHKRKTLRNNLIGFYDKAAVESCLEAGLRAEQLSLDQFTGLYHRLTS